VLSTDIDIALRDREIVCDDVLAKSSNELGVCHDSIFKPLRVHVHITLELASLLRMCLSLLPEPFLT
jgi:hypothetical protein